MILAGSQVVNCGIILEIVKILVQIASAVLIYRIVSHKQLRWQKKRDGLSRYSGPLTATVPIALPFTWGLLLKERICS